MGAWDVTAFGNDEAADMVFEVLEHPSGVRLLEVLFAGAEETGYLQAFDGYRMIGAAAIVATARRGSGFAMPEELAGWVRENEAELGALAGAALAALRRVRADASEVRELLEASDAFAAWDAELDRISAALG